jgi:hypothetical protein
MLNTLASEKYVTFVLYIDNNSCGCMLSRYDAKEFSNKLENLLIDQNNAIMYAELSYDTNYINIEGMATMECIMLAFTDKLNNKTVQLSLNHTMTQELINELKNIEDSISSIYEFNEKPRPWIFFGINENKENSE